MITGKTLQAAMTYSGYNPAIYLADFNRLAPYCETAMVEAHCYTVARRAMFLAQIGAESGSLYWTEEEADGSEYNGRADLGNTQPGDGPRYKGRSFIQVTGRHNYGALSLWAFERGDVPTKTYFVDHPSNLAQDRYAFLGPVWFWETHGMNTFADNHDIVGGTERVNGGQNNIFGRTKRWEKCLKLGNNLIGVTPMDKDIKARFDKTDAEIAALNKLVTSVFSDGTGKPHRFPTWLRAFGLHLKADPDDKNFDAKLAVK